MLLTSSYLSLISQSLYFTYLTSIYLRMSNSFGFLPNYSTLFHFSILFNPSILHNLQSFLPLRVNIILRLVYYSVFHVISNELSHLILVNQLFSLLKFMQCFHLLLIWKLIYCFSYIATFRGQVVRFLCLDAVLLKIYLVHIFCYLIFVRDF